MSWQERIVVDPQILVGKPVIRGTQLSVELIVDLLGQGWTEADVLRNYVLSKNRDGQPRHHSANVESW